MLLLFFFFADNHLFFLACFTSFEILSSNLLISMTVFTRKWRQSWPLFFLPQYSPALVFPVDRHQRGSVKIYFCEVAGLGPVINQDLSQATVFEEWCCLPAHSQVLGGNLTLEDKFSLLDHPVQHQVETHGTSFVLY